MASFLIDNAITSLDKSFMSRVDCGVTFEVFAKSDFMSYNMRWPLLYACILPSFFSFFFFLSITSSRKKSPLPDSNKKYHHSICVFFSLSLSLVSFYDVNSFKNKRAEVMLTATSSAGFIIVYTYTFVTTKKPAASV